MKAEICTELIDVDKDLMIIFSTRRLGTVLF
jgi:hypothetical protein